MTASAVVFYVFLIELIGLDSFDYGFIVLLSSFKACVAAFILFA